MKKVFNYSIIIALFVAIGFTSCEQQYTNNIVGEWQMTKHVYYYNGEKQDEGDIEEGIIWSFTSDGRFIDGTDEDIYTITGKTLIIGDGYEFGASWQIKKLTKKELILKAEDKVEQQSVEYHFKKVS